MVFNLYEEGQDIIATVQKLDWLQPNTTAIQTKINNSNKEPIPSIDYDIILGSDIVYERSLILPLCKVLKSYLYQKEEDKCQKVAYIACTERSHTTLGCFEVV